MHIRLLIALIAIGLVILVFRHIRKQPKQRRPKLILKYGLYLLAIILLGLVITGKVHWITAGIAALIPFVFKLSALALRMLPMVQFWKSTKQQSENFQQKSSSFSGNTSGKMTVQQAKEIFGFDEVVSAEQVTKRHRELMQKMHPDRGGSGYLAVQINSAKDVLLEHLKR